jgi:hypothetical protein
MPLVRIGWSFSCEPSSVPFIHSIPFFFTIWCCNDKAFEGSSYYPNYSEALLEGALLETQSRLTPLVTIQTPIFHMAE